MKEVRMFTLENRGTFSARIEIKWRYTDEKGYLHEGTCREEEIIFSMEKRTADLALMDIPDGVEVRVGVIVTAGIGSLSEESYIFRRDSSAAAAYAVTGTLMKNRMEFKKYVKRAEPTAKSRS